MKEGDENRGHTPAQNAWCPAPPDDPNAALWASIAPPPAPSFGMKLRRRLAALSLEHLAESVRRAFPRLLSSRAKAECAVLGAAMALGASAGLLGFSILGALEADSSEVAVAPEPVPEPLAHQPEPAGVAAAAAAPAVALVAASRVGEKAAAHAPASTARGHAADEVPTLAATALPRVSDDLDTPAPPRVVRRAQQAKKKRSAATGKKKRKSSKRSTARRSTRTRNSKARDLARALTL